MRQPLFIIQARLSSTRLPRKVLKPFFGEKTILDLQIEKIKTELPDARLVVATTKNSADDELVAYCRNKKIAVFRGSETDVLQRFIDCALAYEAENIIRVCSDNPFLDGAGIKYLTTQNFEAFDYVSFKNHLGVPAIKTHWGVFAEWVKTSALQRAARATKSSFYHEHVTNFIYGNDKTFNIALHDAPNAILNRDDVRFTIDTRGDFQVCSEIYQLWDKQGLPSLLDLVDKHKPWLEAMKEGINQFNK